MKRSQIISFDLVVSVIIVVVFLATSIGIVLLLTGRQEPEPFDFEVDYVMMNLETNLEAYDGGLDFFSRYRVNAPKLADFASQFSGQSIDSFVVGNLANTHGIGLSEEAYDICLYFTDVDGQRLEIGPGMESIGMLKSASCNSVPYESNPCEGYRKAISLFKPVLFDEGDIQMNRILQMNIVLCEV